MLHFRYLMEAYKKGVNIRGTAVNTPWTDRYCCPSRFDDSWDTSGAIPSVRRRPFKFTNHNLRHNHPYRVTCTFNVGRCFALCDDELYTNLQLLV